MLTDDERNIERANAKAALAQVILDLGRASAEFARALRDADDEGMAILSVEIEAGKKAAMEAYDGAARAKFLFTRAIEN